MYFAATSRRIGTSDWHGGHHVVQKLIQTALPRRSANRIGAPFRSVSWYVEPSALVTANSGAVAPIFRPTGGGDEMRYAVALGSTAAGPSAVFPSGVVMPISTTPAISTATNTNTSWRPLNGPTTP